MSAAAVGRGTPKWRDLRDVFEKKLGPQRRCLQRSPRQSLMLFWPHVFKNFPKIQLRSKLLQSNLNSSSNMNMLTMKVTTIHTPMRGHEKIHLVLL